MWQRHTQWSNLLIFFFIFHLPLINRKETVIVLLLGTAESKVLKTKTLFLINEITHLEEM